MRVYLLSSTYFCTTVTRSSPSDRTLHISLLFPGHCCNVWGVRMCSFKVTSDNGIKSDNIRIGDGLITRADHRIHINLISILLYILGETLCANRQQEADQSSKKFRDGL